MNCLAYLRKWINIDYNNHQCPVQGVVGSLVLYPSTPSIGDSLFSVIISFILTHCLNYFSSLKSRISPSRLLLFLLFLACITYNRGAPVLLARRGVSSWLWTTRVYLLFGNLYTVLSYYNLGEMSCWLTFFPRWGCCCAVTVCHFWRKCSYIPYFLFTVRLMTCHCSFFVFSILVNPKPSWFVNRSLLF